jgi:hypothetical protein
MSLFDLVFGCWHKRCNFPITVRGKLRRSSVGNRDICCLPRLWPGVPVRLVPNEDPRVQTSHCVGSTVRHCRLRSQGGLRPVPGHSRSPTLGIRSGKWSCCFLSGQRKSRSLN